MAKYSINELKLELSNLLLDLIGFEADDYNGLIQKAKTVEELDKVVNHIVEKQNNSKVEKHLVMFWTKVKQ